MPAIAQSREAAFVDSLLSLMTVEEKLGQLTQYTGHWTSTGPIVPQGEEGQLRAGRVGSFLNIVGAKATRDVQRIAVEETRLGIPVIFGHDTIHGYRTIFPVPLAEAATFDLRAVEKAASIAAREAAAAGIHWTFAPMVDVARDARWGRIVEGSGEDPFLGSAMAVARVRGFQGQDLAANNTVLATAKHFAAYGAAEGGRDYNTVDVSERTLREVFLPPYKAAVDAGAATLMTSFNEIGGVPATGSENLFTKVLRDEWGFDGMVVADYTAVAELLNHGVAADRAEAGLLALNAGVDMSMVDGIYAKDLPAFAGSEQLPTDVLDERVRRVLRAKYRAGLFDDPYRYSDVDREARVLLADEHRAFAREVGREAIVLLKNENQTLPLRKDYGSIAVIGALAADSVSALGSWAATGKPEETVPILVGIQEALPNTRVRYEPGYAPARGGFDQIIAAMLSEDTSGFAEAVRAAEESDAVVLVVGEHREMSGEAASRASVELPGAQKELARAVLSAAGDKPVVVLLTNGRPLAIPHLAETAPAILETWYLGTEMGRAVTDVLFGDYNPSGKLPVSFPRATGQEPLYYNTKPTGRPPVDGQKYTSKYLDVHWTAQYAFGHGLSYTEFAYGEVNLSSTRVGMGEKLSVSVEVTNAGDRVGDEVVQLYVRDEVASVTRPLLELKGFERIRLEPGASTTVSFALSSSDLLFWKGTGWAAEPGFFTVHVGTASDNAKQARFELVSE